MTSKARRRPVTLRGIYYRSITAALASGRTKVEDKFLLSKPHPEQAKIISFRLTAGWSDEQAFGLVLPPERALKAQSHSIKCDGKEFLSEKALAMEDGIKYKALHQRLHRDKWPPEVAVELLPRRQPEHLSCGTTGLIYMWEHIHTDKKYVGLTIDGSRRAWQHLSASCIGRNVPGTLQHALAEFSAEAFAVKVLEKNIPVVILPMRERYWIKKLGTLKPSGYNQNRGGCWGAFPTEIIVNGLSYAGVAGVAKAFNMKVALILSQLSQGWTIEEAIRMRKRVPNSKLPVCVDLGEGKTNFPTALAACRYFCLQYEEVEEYRRKLDTTLVDAINNLHCKISAKPNHGT